MSTDIATAKEKLHELNDVRLLNDNTYVLRFAKNGLDFTPGQYITVGKDGVEARQYSVYSGADEDFAEVLIKEVDGGTVSKQLKSTKPGEKLIVDGPFGHFIIRPDFIESNKKFLFVASGTGISPFHSFVKTYPYLNYQLLHGVRHSQEAYENQDYNRERLTICASRDKTGDFDGRVTDYLRQNEVDLQTEVYLCGNSEMILEVFDILEEKGLPTEQIHTEVYF